MVRVCVVDRDGTIRQEAFSEGQPLMVALKSAGYEIQAICGGSRACATCHVHVAPEWFEATGDMSEDECELVECAESYVPNSSRLSCQIHLAEHLEGLAVTLAPEE